MIFLTLPDLLHIAERTLGSEPSVRDHGMLGAALARPQASVFGSDAYPSLEEKAAALLHSIARNHALVTGNKRLALAATIVLLGINGVRLTMSNDEAYEMVIAVSAGQVNEIHEIAELIRVGSQPR